MKYRNLLTSLMLASAILFSGCSKQPPQITEETDTDIQSPVITDTESLTEIDHYFQESVRYVLYGSMKKRKLSIPYEKLSALGYRTLVFYYYHPDRIQEIRRELPEITSLRD